MKKQWLVIGAIILLAGCGSGGPGEPSVMVNGAGATFPYPLYAKWFDEFHKVHPNFQINYQSIGSGGGIRQLLAGTVDFGASDSPMTYEQLTQAKLKTLHFPTVLGAVVPTYNVAGVTQELNFTGEALAEIFAGKITKWNDPALVKANAGVTLPASGIVLIHRSDGSGTSFVWTDYLSKVSETWKKTIGAGTSVNWPAGLGAKGNEGVAGLVKQTPNALGYVELVYAIQNQMPYGRVRNASGKFVKADLPSVTAAAASVPMPEDFRVSITNASGENAYPVSSFTWILIPSRIADAGKRQALTQFLQWMLADGQKLAPALSYAPLPAEVAGKESAAISQIH
jgi:phosphate transport system substrate-binding protein